MEPIGTLWTIMCYSLVMWFVYVSILMYVEKNWLFSFLLHVRKYSAECNLQLSH